MKKALVLILLLFLCLGCALTALAADRGEPQEPRDTRVEIPSMRTENARFYQNDDGTITAEVQPEISAYQIDNSLIPSDSGADKFENRANSFKAEFPKSLGRADEKLLDFNFKDTSLSFQLQDTGGLSERFLPITGEVPDPGEDLIVDVPENNGAVTEVYDHTPKAEDLTGTAVTGEISGDTIKYPDLLPSADFQYQILDNGIKETIILKDRTAPAQFSFKINADNLDWKATASGRIIFFAQGTDTRLFYLSPVSAVDAYGAKCQAVTQSIRQEGGLFIDITIDQDRLTDSQYPLTIDPTITLAPDEAESMDTYIVHPEDPFEDDMWTYGIIRVGRSDPYDEKYRGLIKFNLSSLPKGTVISASLRLKSNKDPVYPIYAYRVTQEWLEAEATYTKAKYDEPWTQAGGSYDPSSQITLQEDNYYWADLTSIADGWINGTLPNYGLILIADETIEDPASIRFGFYSGRRDSLDERPTLSIIYEPDIELPSVNLTSPAAGPVTGQVAVSAIASDVSGINRVDFYAGDTLLGTSSSAPYQITWDTCQTPDGDYQLQARAYDLEGNVGLSNYIEICDTFADLSKVNVFSTKARWQDGTYSFTSSRNTLVSRTFTLSETVKNVTLEAPSPSSFNFSVQAGSTWYPVENGVVIPLSSPSNRITFKAVLKSGVSSATLTYYRLICEKSSDCTVTVSNPVLPPAALTAVPEQNTVRLDWQPSALTGATYKIYRSTSPGLVPSPERLIGTTNSSSYLDSTSGLFGTYYYRVTAVSRFGTESDPSNEASATVNLPSAPTGLTAVPHEGSGIDLTWTASATPGVTYQLYRSTYAGFTPSTDNRIAGQITTVSYADTQGLTLGAAYYYRVSALLSGVESQTSNEAGTVNGGAPYHAQNRLGVKSFWTYAGFELPGGEGMINLGSGNLVARYTDSLLPGNKLAAEVRRTYNSLDKSAGPLGIGWSLNLAQSLTVNPDDSITFNQGDGYQANFAFDPATNSYRCPSGFYLTLTKNPDGTYTIYRKDNLRYLFNPGGKLTAIKDLNNNTISYNYTGGLLTSVTDTVGRSTSFTYDSNGRITSVQDQRPSPTSYSYDAAGNLIQVLDPMGYITCFEYDANHNLTGVTGPGGTRHNISYNAAGCVTRLADGLSYHSDFSWNFQSGQTVLVNPRRYSTTFTLDPFGSVVAISDPLGGSSSYSYDTGHNLISCTDPAGNTTAYTYDTAGNMLTKTNAAGTYIATYNTLSLPLSLTNPQNGTTIYTYDTAGNLTGSQDPMGYATTYQNDTYGRRLRCTDPGGGITTYGYDNYGNLITQTDANGYTTTYTYDPMGLPTSIQDPTGATTLYTYDNLGRLTRTDYPDGTWKLVSINGDHLVTAETHRNRTRTEYSYDAAGRLAHITDPLGHTTIYNYDQNGNRTEIIYPDYTSVTFTYDALDRLETETDPLGSTTTFLYDTRGNMTEVVHPAGHAEFQNYDTLNRVTAYGRRETSGGADLNVTTYTYDQMGNKLSETDPLGHTTTYQYNDNGWLISVTDALNAVTSYVYDQCGRLTSVTDANNHTTTYTYDPMGHKTRETFPDLTTTRWTYDAAGRMATRTDGKNKKTTYTYDQMNRLTRTTPVSGSSVTYTYDQMGNRLTMVDGTGTTSYRYDLKGNLVEVQDYLGRRISYTYDSLDQRLSMNAGFGTVSYEYDDAGNVSAVTDFGGNRITLAYDPENRIESITFPQRGTTLYTYNHLDQLATVNANKDAETYWLYQYQYDSNSNRTTITKEGSSETVNCQYTYDNLNRLTRWTSNIYYEESRYTYDSVGNRLSMKTFKSPTFISDLAYTYDNCNRLTYSANDRGAKNTHTYSYDANGNLIGDLHETHPSSYTYFESLIVSQYDSENRLTRNEIRDSGDDVHLWTDFIYNGDGLLVENRTGPSYLDSAYYQYDGDQVIADLDGAGALKAWYTRLPDGRILSEYIGEYEERDIYYNATDHLGTVVFRISKESGEAEGGGYRDFGTASGGSRFGFAGAPYFSGPGLYQMGARYYDPAVGRFITRDTYKGDIYQPWTQNLYVYCNNNPVNYIDPTGHYYRPAAVDYATNPNYSSPDRNSGMGQGFRKHNPQYERFDNIISSIIGFHKPGGDCANFVSQALIAGGIGMNNNWHYYLDVETGYDGMSYNLLRDMTNSWAVAPSQFGYFSNPDNGYINGNVVQILQESEIKDAVRTFGIQPGDLLYWVDRGSRAVGHSTIITKIENGNIYFSGHSRDRMNEPVSQKNMDDQNAWLWVIRIKDDAQ